MENGASVTYLETPSVLKLVGIPYSTLDYWVRTGLVEPSIRAGTGRRRSRRWSITDLVCVKALKELREAGASVRLLGIARERLSADWTPSLSSQLMYWDGGDLVLIDEWENLISLVKHPGQATLRVVALPLDSFADEARREIVRITRLTKSNRATA